MENRSKEVKNPCVQICTQDPDSGFCIGCSRTSAEIMEWPTMTNEQRRQILEQLTKR